MQLDMGNGFKTQFIDFSLEMLYEKVKSGDVEVCPEYKYTKAWQKHTRSRFIEAILLGIPINNLWFEQNSYGQFSIIDGSQCVRTVVDFIDDAFSLSDINMIAHIEGCRFSELAYHDQRKIQRSEVLVRVINYDVAPLLKCEFYKRITSGSIRSRPQMARNFAFRRAYFQLTEDFNIIKSLIEFPINKTLYGERKAVRILAEHEFMLAVLLIQLVKLGRFDLNPDCSMDFALDYVAMLLDEGKLWFDKDFFVNSHQEVIHVLSMNDPDLDGMLRLEFNRYSYTSRGRKNYNVNDYLNMLTFGANNLRDGHLKKRKIDFFSPNTRLSSLFRCSHL